MAAFLDIVEEAVVRLISAVTSRAQWVIRTMIHDALEHFTLDQIKTKKLQETTDMHIDKYLKAGNPSNPLERGCFTQTASSH